MADAAADTKGAPQPPPHLRMSTEESHECGDCTHYQRGKCVKYSNLPVDDEWVCDSWAKSSSGDQDADMADDAKEPPAKNVRQAEQNARSRIRAARRQQASGQEPDQK